MRGSPLLARCRVGTQLPDMEASEAPDAWFRCWRATELAHNCQIWKALTNHIAPRGVLAAALANRQDKHFSAVHATAASAATTADHRP